MVDLRVGCWADKTVLKSVGGMVVWTVDEMAGSWVASMVDLKVEMLACEQADLLVAAKAAPWAVWWALK